MRAWNRRAKWTTTIAAAAAAMVAFSGCAGSDPDSGEGGSEVSIAWVVGNTQDAFYQKATEGAMAEAEALGVNLIVQGPDAFDPAKQIPVVDSLLAQAPDALAIAPVDPEALRAPLSRWADAGIPIVTFDNGLTDPGFDVVSEIGSDNYAGGEMAAEEMAGLIDGAGQVAIIDFNTSNVVLNARADGFRDFLESEYPEIEIVEVQYTEADFPRAQTLTQTFVNKYPDLAGIFATYSFATEYAAKGLQDLGVDGTVMLVGFEAGDKQIEALRDGSLQATIAQQPAEQGAQAVRAAYYAVMGDTGEIEPVVKTENVVITGANLDSMTQFFYAVG